MVPSVNKIPTHPVKNPPRSNSRVRRADMSISSWISATITTGLLKGARKTWKTGLWISAALVANQRKPSPVSLVYLTKSTASPKNCQRDFLVYGIPGRGLGRACQKRKVRKTVIRALLTATLFPEIRSPRPSSFDKGSARGNVPLALYVVAMAYDMCPLEFLGERDYRIREDYLQRFSVGLFRSEYRQYKSMLPI